LIRPLFFQFRQNVIHRLAVSKWACETENRVLRSIGACL
jgi:hypothetical protein